MSLGERGTCNKGRMLAATIRLVDWTQYAWRYTSSASDGLRALSRRCTHLSSTDTCMATTKAATNDTWPHDALLLRLQYHRTVRIPVAASTRFGWRHRLAPRLQATWHACRIWTKRDTTWPMYDMPYACMSTWDMVCTVVVCFVFASAQRYLTLCRLHPDA